MNKTIQQIFDEERKKSEINKIPERNLNIRLGVADRKNNPDFIKKQRLAKIGKPGHKHTDEGKKNISKAGKGIKKPVRSKEVKATVSKKLTGRKRTPEECKAISEGLKGHSVSDERRTNISAGLIGVMKGVPKRTTICPHCNKVGGIAPMKRFHFDNCKQK